MFLATTIIKKVGTSLFATNCYIVDFQQKPEKAFQKSRDIALWRPSYLLTKVFSVYFCDVKT